MRFGSNSIRYPVLIVGAGPVGLLLANLLGQQGVRCLLIDKHHRQPDWSRAIGLTPPSLGILKEVGLHRKIMENAVLVEQARVHDDWGEVGTVRFVDLPSEFRFILAIPQSRTMQILTDGLRQHSGVTFWPGAELIRLAQEKEHVRAVMLRDNGMGAGEIEAGWVIGCDGHASSTRALAGIPHSRRAYAPSFVMGDYPDQTGWGKEAHLFFTAHGSLESFPLPAGQRRWVALLPANRRGCTAGFLEAQTKRLSGQDLTGLPCSMQSEFVPERLLVQAYVQGRVLLAGDAAHVMSPIGGHGMNTGFADAEFLAKIMGQLEDPKRCDLLLRAYDRYRRRAFRAACARAAFGMWLGTRTGRIASALRGKFLRWVLLRPPVADRLPPHFAMLTIPFHRVAQVPLQGGRVLSEGAGCS